MKWKGGQNIRGGTYPYHKRYANTQPYYRRHSRGVCPSLRSSAAFWRCRLRFIGASRCIVKFDWLAGVALTGHCWLVVYVFVLVVRGRCRWWWENTSRYLDWIFTSDFHFPASFFNKRAEVRRSSSFDIYPGQKIRIGEVCVI